MKNFIKSIPLAILLPLCLFAGSVEPQQAAANLAKWKQLGSWVNVTWIAGIAGNNWVGLAALLLAAIYSFFAWYPNNLILNNKRADARQTSDMSTLSVSEQQRRKKILKEITASWINSHFNKIETPPIDWINQALRDRNETWSVANLEVAPVPTRVPVQPPLIRIRDSGRFIINDVSGRVKGEGISIENSIDFQLENIKLSSE